MVLLRTLLLLGALIGLSIAAGPAPKPAIPDAPALREATSSFQKIYGGELADVQLPNDFAIWSKQLLKELDRNPPDSAFRYVLLTKAISLAISAGDVPLAFRAVERVDAEWSVDALRLKADVLIKSIPKMRKPQERMEWLGAAKTVGDQAAADDRYAIARELDEGAKTVSAPVRTAALSSYLKARKESIDELAAAHAAVAPLLAKLQTAPNDSAVNLAVGKFQAFMKGNWPSGLAKIAMGNDPALRDLALRDQAAIDNPDDRVALADAWWDLAEKQTGIARRNLRLHAASWYQLASSDLSGLTKMAVARRLAEITAEPGLQPTVIPPIATPKPIDVVQNQTDAKEASDVIAWVRQHYPDALRDMKNFELVRYHNAAQIQGGAGEMEISGSYAPISKKASGGGISLWGIYEKWPPGRYLIVYRLQALRPIDQGDCCFVDVCVKGVTLASSKPQPDEMEPGKWVCIPIPAELDSEKELEFRLWPDDHLIALDRIYIFRVQ